MREHFRFITSAMVLGLTLCALPILYAQNISVDQDGIDVRESTEQIIEDANQTLIEKKFNDDKSLSLIGLILRGGKMMLFIGLLSIFVVTLAFERAFALRKSHIMPPQLLNELDRLQDHEQGLNPSDAYQACGKYPSALANVVMAMLLRVGRPQSEVEHAVAEASEREADQMYHNVRWLTLAAGIAPLMGLLGTVWGIIWAFFETTKLEIGANRADQLAEGIYVALVTTLGGLAVAIPAAILAQYFESRIIKLFHQIDLELFNLIPSVERYEGKMRTSHDSLNDENGQTVATAAGNTTN